MKEEIAFRNTKTLRHTRAFFDIFSWLTDKAVAGREKEIFGTKPGVADYKKVDTGEEAKRATAANLANIGDIQALLEKILPGYKNIVGQDSKNIQSMLRGELPEDVQRAVQRSSAFKSLQGGYGVGSGMGRALTARDIGRTSLDLTQAGGNASQRWMGQTQNSVSPFMVTTPMQLEVTGKNNLFDQATKQFALNVAAAPDPAAAGKFNFQTALGSMAASFGMGAMGGMGGMGGGGSGGQSGTGMASGASSAGSQYSASPYSAWGPWATGYKWGG